MKYVKILSLAAIVSLAFACQKQVYPEFEPGPKDVKEGKTEVYFPITNASEEMEPTAESYEITVARTVSTNALSVPITSFDPAGIFDIPATIEFAAGEEETTLKVGVTRMELEKNYEFTIGITFENYYAYKADSEVSDKISFHFSGLKQKWVDAGECVFADYTWGEDVVIVEGRIPIQNHEGTDDYRIVKPYATIVPGTEGNVIFTLKNNKISFASGLSDFWPGTGYFFVWDTKNYGNYCFIDDYVFNEDGSVSVGVNFLLAEGNVPSYICWFGFDWYNSPIVPENETE